MSSICIIYRSSYMLRAVESIRSLLHASTAVRTAPSSTSQTDSWYSNMLSNMSTSKGQRLGTPLEFSGGLTQLQVSVWSNTRGLHYDESSNTWEYIHVTRACHFLISLTDFQWCAGTLQQLEKEVHKTQAPLHIEVSTSYCTAWISVLELLTTCLHYNL